MAARATPHRRRNFQRILAILLAGILAAAPLTARPQQPAPVSLNIVIVEGEGAINNIRQRTAREPVVRVEDENRRPVAGAVVVFILPESGPGGTFPNGARSLTVVTDSQGQAVAKGFTPSQVTGKFQIQIEAAYQELSATGTINQANAVLTAAAAGGGGAAGGISGKLLLVLAIAGAAAAGSIVAATSGNGNGSSGGSAPGAPTVVTPGTPTVGPPPGGARINLPAR